MRTHKLILHIHGVTSQINVTPLRNRNVKESMSMRVMALSEWIYDATDDVVIKNRDITTDFVDIIKFKLWVSTNTDDAYPILDQSEMEDIFYAKI